MKGKSYISMDNDFLTSFSSSGGVPKKKENWSTLLMLQITSKILLSERKNKHGEKLNERFTNLCAFLILHLLNHVPPNNQSGFSSQSTHNRTWIYHFSHTSQHKTSRRYKSQHFNRKLYIVSFLHYWELYCSRKSGLETLLCLIAMAFPSQGLNIFNSMGIYSSFLPPYKIIRMLHNFNIISTWYSPTKCNWFIILPRSFPWDINKWSVELFFHYDFLNIWKSTICKSFNIML